MRFPSNLLDSRIGQYKTWGQRCKSCLRVLADTPTGTATLQCDRFERAHLKHGSQKQDLGLL